MNEVWLSTILKRLAPNGNRGTQQESSVSTKVSEEVEPFQQEFSAEECDVKVIPFGLPESESDKKIRLRHRLRFLVFLGIRLHPKTSDSLWLRHPLCNPDVYRVYLSPTELRVSIVNSAKCTKVENWEQQLRKTSWGECKFSFPIYIGKEKTTSGTAKQSKLSSLHWRNKQNGSAIFNRICKWQCTWKTDQRACSRKKKENLNVFTCVSSVVLAASPGRVRSETRSYCSAPAAVPCWLIS